MKRGEYKRRQARRGTKNMTQKQAQTIEQALARAVKEGIRILGRGQMKADGSKFWLVSSSQYAKTNRAYIVTIAGDGLHCNCQASGICKHRAVVHQELKQQAERKESAQMPDDAKWALLEQFMPERAAELHQAAQEVTARLAALVEQMDSVQIDENLWGDGDTDAPRCSDDRCAGQPATHDVHGILLCEAHAQEFQQKQAELVASLEKIPALPLTKAQRDKATALPAERGIYFEDGCPMKA